MQLEYTRATKEDVEEICRLADDVILRYEDFHTVNEEKSLGWTHLSIAQNIERFAVIRYQGHKAGYLLLTPGNGRYEINYLFVLPYYQNKGIGTAVIQQCIRDTKGNVQVYVFTGDIGTYSLFEQLGFRAKEVFHRTRYVMVYENQEENEEGMEEEEEDFFDL